MLTGTPFDGDDFIEVPHNASMALANGTIAVTFTADAVTGSHTLYSKDAKGLRCRRTSGGLCAR